MRDCILQGDCLALLKTLPENSVDSIVTDPPYGLGEVKDIAGLIRAWLQDEDDSKYTGKGGFMGQAWDAGVPSPRYWREAYRVLKPGGHVLCFAGTRTLDLMSLSLRLAGFEDRDTINHLAWCYGSGFPKSHNISVAIDKLKGKERQIIGRAKKNGGASNGRNSPSVGYVCTTNEYDVTLPATPEAQRWQGFGTALKPAWEPILLFRKPLAAGSIAANVLEWGTGAINIDSTRVQTDETLGRAKGGWLKGGYVGGVSPQWNSIGTTKEGGRWPPNLLLSHSAACLPGACAEDCAVAEIDRQSGYSVSKAATSGGFNFRGDTRHDHSKVFGVDDAGGASRFFPTFGYFPKASRRERNDGCEALPVKTVGSLQGGDAGYTDPVSSRFRKTAANIHPTVKSLALMRWLVRLVTPPAGIVLDCFAGSGSTLVACVQEGFHYIGIEQDASYVEICKARLKAAKPAQPKPRAKIVRLPKRPKEIEQLAMFA